ncbi:MAG1210 family protein [Williamsoniiplasma lucivorax]|uniref:Uncharacterized protein n=1 Tax=Williamsoniiplasma lucivorax TaxID=209274 RepID=A0A2S5REH5_9MOLU|nr:hypothetical protein [Williamsoniiplasma lucivorax]PPE05535.1 hypothetical protein ELUCI_v1c06280 [Williamsoniiplasma lucivorax]
MFEPVKNYLQYKQQHQELMEKKLNEFIQMSQIDAAHNQDLMQQKTKKDDELNNFKGELKKVKLLKALVIIGFGLFFGLALLSILFIFGVDTGVADFVWWICFSFGLIIGIGLLVLLFTRIKQSNALWTNKVKKKEGEIAILIEEGWASLTSLNQILHWTEFNQEIEQVIPNLQLDHYLSHQVMEMMTKTFQTNLPDFDDRFAIGLQSGSINGNPLIWMNERVRGWVNHVYTGSIAISWTETVTVNGKNETRSRSQTLTAHVEKPRPNYTEEARLIFVCDLAPNLQFSRKIGEPLHEDWKKVEKEVENEYRKLEKKAQKAIKNDQSFNLLSNKAFEVLFNATNRNHEIEFRVLFTALAQSQMVELFKSKDIGLGDYFNFSKREKVNEIRAEILQQINHFNNIDLNHYDLAWIKTNLLAVANKYFDLLYLSLLPILVIPGYQDYKTQEFIYEANENQSATTSYLEQELIASNFMQALKHPNSITKNILKTTVEAVHPDYDLINVTAHGFDGIEHIEYVSVYGPDGRWHQVPVLWIEYRPVAQSKKIMIHKTKNLKSFADFKNATNHLNERELGSHNMVYKKEIAGFLIDDPENEETLMQIKSFFNQA